MKFCLVTLLILGLCVLLSQEEIPQLEPTYTGDYYNGINGNLFGNALKEELSQLIAKNITLTSYNDLWIKFNTTDTEWSSCPEKIHDIYSSKCWTYKTDQCGNYKKEGDCYNREHSWPKSWWGGSSADGNAYVDLHHIYPSDGYVNGLRGNEPFGNVIPGSEYYVSSNGCKLGECLVPGNHTIKCFEVADKLKGDLARTYFYMATRYLDEFTCCVEYGVDDNFIRPWMEEVLREWSLKDVVDSDEIYRNTAVFDIQGNRNPFVDYPAYVIKIRDF
eukprot:TRINITY_DN449_c0_g1_i1.p1 TRINITY_DN449_c0_g1~~TRINITY_DN449_c0_g1_i1.p1  ORF type:complete len:275 (-),score=65.94 TRINITY_DN449_c0_g1_i1:193-1017(-)